MTVTINNQIEIACTPQALFDYVTQPWLWHEWHPNSVSAQADVARLRVGDHFDERIALQPLLPLMPTLKRETHYTVLKSRNAEEWQVKGVMKDGWLIIHYRFAPSGIGTLFNRQLDFSASGISRLLLPLLKRRMAQKSLVALGNLKRKMESAGPRH